ncbi:MAG: type II toxin-antitoxin system RelE/ParE family toxin [Proteobacteria bacterium]|nr:type II toxin-antitoxin system RelE/ParE family toxin [Pseudomonadota bacterium]
MIRGWKTSRAQRFAKSGVGKYRGLDREKALARLQLLDAVSRLEQIPALGSIGLHKLRGDRRGEWAMTINGPWRLVFTFRDGDAYGVDIVDYH